MSKDEFWILTALIYIFVVSIIIIIGLVRKNNKDKIVLLTDNCDGCPFHVYQDNNEGRNKYGCKLHLINMGGLLLTDTKENLKQHCPITGKLKITIEKQ